jgi:hypothetical protein
VTPLWSTGSGPRPHPPGRLTSLRAHSSAGRALGWQPRGQGFESPWVHRHRRCSRSVRGVLLLRPVALVAAAVSLITLATSGRRPRQDRQRQLFADAFEACIEYREFAYSVRRRTDDSPDEVKRITGAMSVCRRDSVHRKLVFESSPRAWGPLLRARCPDEGRGRIAGSRGAGKRRRFAGSNGPDRGRRLRASRPIGTFLMRRSRRVMSSTRSSPTSSVAAETVARLLYLLASIWPE